MIYRKPREDEKQLFNSLAEHPLQSWAWGSFRENTGVSTERLIGFEGSNAKEQAQITFHKIPKLPYTVGYFPKGIRPHEGQLETLKELGRRKKAIFIKLEPNISSPPLSNDEVEGLRQFLLDYGLEEGRALFTKYTFLLDLTKSEDELLSQMKSKTRYNVRLAEKKGVQVVEDNTDEGFSEYLHLLELTTKRQQFYAHTKSYQTKMWEHLGKSGVARILKATYQGKTLAAWILFVYKDTLYYPYGASSRENPEVMASNLLMFEAMKYGKQHNLSYFDLWGALGPKPDKSDPWYGFHRFKKGYGGALAEFAGTYDLIVEPTLYPLYRMADRWRWRWLRLKSRLPFLG